MNRSNKPHSDKPASEKQEVIFILSVDVEEEWDWSDSFPQENCSVENTRQIPRFQEFCESLGIRPTYFVDYAVVNDQRSVSNLRKPLQDKKCEIGAHLHPWCNPPISGENNEKESHVVNLPIDLVEQKLAELSRKLKEAFGQAPSAFRSGRWGINSKVLKLLAQKGYDIDSSVYPYYSNDYFSCEGATITPYWPNYDTPLQPGQQQEIFEIPVTAGFNRANYTFWSRIHRALSARPYSLFHSLGILWHTGILKKLYLSPELTSAPDMTSLIKSSLAREHRVIHMYLHSPSLMAGATEYTRTEADVEKLYTKIETVMHYLTKNTNITNCTISEAKSVLTDSSLLKTKD